MKKVIFCLIATVLLSTSLVANNLSSFSNKIEKVANLKRIKVDTWLTSTGGVKYHITGWVDVSIGFGGVSISHYDITIAGGGISIHFQGKVASTPNKDGSVTNEVTGDLTQNGKIVEMSEDIKDLIIKCNDEVLKVNK